MKLDFLLDWAKEIVMHTSIDGHNLISFRNLAKLIINLGDKNSLNIFCTHLLVNAYPNHFLIFLEEMSNKGKDTLEAEKIFISLISIHNYDCQIIDQYLKIINQDASYLTKQLLQNSLSRSLCHLIRKTDMKHWKGHIIPTILQYYTGDKIVYLDIVLQIVQVTPDFTEILLKNNKHIGSCQDDFAQYLINYFNNNLPAIKNFSFFLQDNDPESFLKFENDYLQVARPDLILQFALQVAFSNKRKILIRLVEIKNESILVEFIKNFPEYDSLMPML
jgi:hypothetical protein